MIGVVDIGGTKLHAAVSHDGVRFENLVRRDTPPGNPAETLTEMLHQAGNDGQLSAITLSVPGPFRRDPPGLVNPPGLPGAWHDLDFQTTLGKTFDCSVVAENDANCSALAEAIAGAGRGYRTVVYFTVSTGIGTGVVRDGNLIIGRHDTEGGHMVLWPKEFGGPPCSCGGYGCLETLAAGRRFQERFGQDATTLESQESWDEIGRWLGLAVVNTTAMVDPDAVVFGGGVTQAWDRFKGALHATVDQYLHLQPAPVILRAALVDGENNLRGALLNLNQTNKSAIAQQ